MCYRIAVRTSITSEFRLPNLRGEYLNVRRESFEITEGANSTGQWKLPSFHSPDSLDGRRDHKSLSRIFEPHRLEARCQIKLELQVAASIWILKLERLCMRFKPEDIVGDWIDPDSSGLLHPDDERVTLLHDSRYAIEIAVLH